MEQIMGLRNDLHTRLKKQVPDLPATRSELIDMVAKEFPWRLTADGAVAIPFEAGSDPRVKVLRQALEPALYMSKSKPNSKLPPGAKLHQRIIHSVTRSMKQGDPNTNYVTQIMRQDRFFRHVSVEGSALETATDFRVAEGVAHPRLLAAIKKHHPQFATAQIPTEEVYLDGSPINSCEQPKQEIIYRVPKAKEKKDGMLSLSGMEMVTHGNQKPARPLGT
jgi:hypothetical protein